MKIWKLRIIGYTSSVALATMLVLAILTLGGCSTLFGPPGNLSPEQLKALAADKNASVVCAVTPTPWGPVKVAVVSIDKSAIASGTAVAEGGCDKVTITADPKPVAPPKETKP